MIDLLYAQAFGLVEPALKQELGFSSTSCLWPLMQQNLTLFQLPIRATSFHPSTLDYVLG